MKISERLVDDFLAYHGYRDVVYEPDGEVPPDFLLDGRIAVEARRLNQNYKTGAHTQGLEKLRIPLQCKIKKLVLSLGPPTQGASWFVGFRFRRPVERWKKLEPKLHGALKGFITGATHTETRLKIGNRFEVRISRASDLRSTFYVLGHTTDRNAGGWEISEMEKNLRICISDKMKKIAKFKPKYPVWWLVFEDRIGYGLDGFDQKKLRELMCLPPHWDKIILVDAQNHTRAFEL